MAEVDRLAREVARLPGALGRDDLDLARRERAHRLLERARVRPGCHRVHDQPEDTGSSASLEPRCALLEERLDALAVICRRDGRALQLRLELEDLVEPASSERRRSRFVQASASGGRAASSARERRDSSASSPASTTRSHRPCVSASWAGTRRPVAHISNARW